MRSHSHPSDRHDPEPAAGRGRSADIPLSRRRALTLTAGAVAAPVALSALPTRATAAPPAHTAATVPFRDPGLPLAERVEDLLRRLRLDEKLALLHQYQPAIERLGVAEFKTGTEALHGVAWSTDRTHDGAVVTATATVFPQSVGLASTWNPELVRRVGTVVGTEARGFHARRPGLWGLQLWAPVVNLLRDPRWGRNEEGYSEDPLLTGVMATAYGGGIAGDDADRLRAAPVLKHYLGYNNEIRRDTTSSMLPPRVRHEYYLAAFRPAIEAGAATGVMSSYNLINGRPASAHHDYNDVVRTWTNRRCATSPTRAGPTTSPAARTTTPRRPRPTRRCSSAGWTASPSTTPMRGRPSPPYARRWTGDCSTSPTDTAVRHILNLRFRLGEFDPDGGPYGEIGDEVIDTREHRAVNREAATQAVVLLKNDSRTLPWDVSRRWDRSRWWDRWPTRSTPTGTRARCRTG